MLINVHVQFTFRISGRLFISQHLFPYGHMQGYTFYFQLLYAIILTVLNIYLSHKYFLKSGNYYNVLILSVNIVNLHSSGARRQGEVREIVSKHDSLGRSDIQYWRVMHMPKTHSKIVQNFLFF